MMMVAAKKIDRDTSAAAERMAWLFMGHRGVGGDMDLLGFRKRGGLRPAGGKIASSTMITVASTINPKSIRAPTESKLADSPPQHQDDHGEEQRERDGGADDQRACAESPRKIHCNNTIRRMPSTML